MHLTQPVSSVLLLHIISLCAFPSIATSAGFWGPSSGDTALFDHSFNIHEITDDTYESTMQDKDHVWIIDFYAPWCPHCRHFAPQWESVADHYASSELIRVGTVDCVKNRKCCALENIDRYPAIKLFHREKDSMKNEMLTTFSKRNTEGVIEWVEDFLEQQSLSSGVSREAGNQDAKEIMARVVPNKNGKKTVERTKGHVSHMKDAALALIFSLEHGTFMGHIELENERYDAAVRWLDLVSKTFPMEENRAALAKLRDRVKAQEKWGMDDWTSMMEEWKSSTKSSTNPPSIFARDLEWEECSSYTCGIWTMFHMLSIRRSVEVSDLSVAEVVLGIRSFIEHFFGCKECVEHFLKANPPSVADTISEEGDLGLIYWLWRMHNTVNRVLGHKMWPQKESCTRCYTSISKDERKHWTQDYDKEQVVEYVRYFYSLQDTEVEFVEESKRSVLGMHEARPSGGSSSVADTTLAKMFLFGVTCCALVSVGWKSRQLPSPTKNQYGHVA